MTLLLSSMWRTFRPFSSIWLNFTSHRALYYASSVTCRDIRQNSVRASLSISYHTHYCFHIRSEDQFYMSRTEHFGHATPWPCFRAPGRGGWKNRINLAGKVAKNTVSVLPNILYPYCQTYCIRTAKHSPLKCDLIFHAECLFWWAWIRSVNFLWATATAPIFLHSLSPRPVNASAQVYKCVNYMFNIVGKLVLERRRRTEEEGRKEGKFARRWREKTWKELVSICVRHFVFPSSSVTLG